MAALTPSTPYSRLALASTTGAASAPTPSEWDKFQAVYTAAMEDARAFLHELSDKTASPDYKELNKRITAIVEGQNYVLRRSKTLPVEQQAHSRSYIDAFTPLIKMAKLKTPCFLLTLGFDSLNAAATPAAFQATLKEYLEKLKNSLPLLASITDPNTLDPEILPAFEKVMQTLEENTTELIIEEISFKQFILSPDPGSEAAAYRTLDRIAAQIDRVLAHVSEAGFTEVIRVKFASRAFHSAIATFQKLQSTNTPVEFQATLCRAFTQTLEALPSLAKEDEPRVMNPLFSSVITFLLTTVEKSTQRLLVEGVSFKEFLDPETAGSVAPSTSVNLEELAAKIHRAIANVSDVSFLPPVKAKLTEELTISIAERLVAIRTIPVEDLQNSIPQLLGFLKDLTNLKADNENPRVINAADAASFKSYLKDFFTQLDFVLVADKTLTEFIVSPAETLGPEEELTGAAAMPTEAVAAAASAAFEEVFAADLNLLRTAADIIEEWSHLISSTLTLEIPDGDDLSQEGDTGYTSDGGDESE